LKFPDNFYWGTATAAYQVEGGIRNSWSAAGEKYDAGIACDHYNRFEEDFDLAKKMNNNAHRFSIEWARIEPTEGNFNQAEIEHYRQVILSLKKRGIEPFVTLYHWTLPAWFSEKGGWLDIGAPQYFARFTEKTVNEYKDLVKFWITINEPNIYTAHSFLRGAWPPFKKSFYVTQQVVRTLIESHKKAYEVIHRIDSDAMVGITNNNNNFKGILKFFSDDYWNHQFFRAINDYQDFVGVNYYFSSSVFDVILRARERSDLNWKIDPKGIYRVLKDLKIYGKPIYIMENGLADAKDEKREKFINDHLEWAHKAIGEGVDVRGYFYWSLLDNFEWDKGFEPRFGLIEIDYKTLERTPRPSSVKYAEICKNNSIKT
jgi:beta-glucosidase